MLIKLQRQAGFGFINDIPIIAEITAEPIVCPKLFALSRRV
jgi:hypothetical protein